MKPHCLQRAMTRIPLWIKITAPILALSLLSAPRLPDVKWMLFAVGLTVKVEQKVNKRQFLKKVVVGLSTVAVALGFGSHATPKAEAIIYSTPNYDDYLDQASDPAAPGSGKTRIYTKSGLLYKRTSDGVVSPFGSAVMSASYIIFIDANDSNKIKALNGTTGAIDYSGTEPAAVIYNAISALTSGGRVFIREGTYTLASLNVSMGGSLGSAAIGSTSLSGIELCGEGKATILKAAANLNGTVVGVLDVNNWYVHDLEIDGNRANQSGAGSNPELIGVSIYNSTGSTVRSCYVHDCKTFGICMYGPTSLILDNYVANCNANCIQLLGGSQCVIAHNVTNGASDVGISLSGEPNLVDVICEGNIVQNVNLNISPFLEGSGGTALGIDIGDNGYVTRGIVRGNIVETAGAWGITSQPTGTNADLSIEGNEVYNCGGGIYIALVVRCSVKNNLVDTTTLTSVNGRAIFVDNNCTAISVDGNTVVDCAADVAIFSASSTKIVNCQVILWASTPGYGAGITILADESVVNSNIVDASAAGLHTWLIHVQCNYATVIGNELIGSSSNPQSNMIYIDGATYSSILGNVITHASSPGINDTGTANHIAGNIGVNPIGKINSPLNTSPNTVGTNGTTSTPVASTDYVAQGPDLMVNSAGGTGVSITIKDGTGNAILSGLTSLSAQRLPYGWKINFGAFSSAPTVTVFGE